MRTRGTHRRFWQKTTMVAGLCIALSAIIVACTSNSASESYNKTNVVGRWESTQPQLPERWRDAPVPDASPSSVTAKAEQSEAQVDTAISMSKAGVQVPEAALRQLSDAKDPDGLFEVEMRRAVDDETDLLKPLASMPALSTPGAPSTGRGAGKRAATAATPPPPPQEAVARRAARPPTPRFDEELWVIEKKPRGNLTISPPFPDKDRRDDTAPGCGSLVVREPEVDGKTRIVPVPLEHTDVVAQVTGYVSTVNVTQRFHNPFSSKIEAVYVFPLPEDAAVNDFVMTIGSRTIRGIIRERNEARAIYEAARAQGKVASLLSQERPNIFTQSVANIEPGKRIDVTITYFNTLAYRDGAYEFVFPMVVGPRFNPPSSGNTGVGAVARGDIGSSGQPTEVQYLRPGERSGHDISLTLAIDAGMELGDVRGITHAVDVRRKGDNRAIVTLNQNDSIPNRDFVLRYTLAASELKNAMVIQPDPRNSGWDYFTLMLVPPENLTRMERRPMEMVFLVDCSGSMDGKPIEQAKSAAIRTLRQMKPGDTFAIIRFAAAPSTFRDRPVEATPENVKKGIKYIESLQSEGGTYMLDGVRAALNFPKGRWRDGELERDRTRFVCFMTDGYIGNEAEVLTELREHLGDTRIFSFGVGTSTNRYLLDGAARIGRGAVAYLDPQDDGGQIMDRFFERISHPSLSNVQLECGDVQVSDIYPRQIPDLYAGRPVVISGRIKSGSRGTINLTGLVGGRSQTIGVRVRDAEKAEAQSGLDAVWARMKIRDLTESGLGGVESQDTIGEVMHVALAHNLVSRQTSFVAVDSLSQTSGDHGVTVAVPVPTPEGVRYETTVRER